MKKNRIIACIMILTMLLTSGVGNIGEVLTSFAQGKNNIIITDILNEKPLPTLDNKFLLEIPHTGFENQWNELYKKSQIKHIKKKFNISKSDATEIFHKVKQDVESVKTLRLK